MLSCLCQLCTTYLYRLQGPMARDKVSRWLHKTMKPVLLNLRKGNLQAPEQHVSHFGSLLDAVQGAAESPASGLAVHCAWYETVCACRASFPCCACPVCLDLGSDILTMRFS